MTRTRLGRALRTALGALVFVGLVIDCVLSHYLRRIGRAPHAAAPDRRA